MLDVPGDDKSSLSLTLIDIPCLPIHEVLAEEVVAGGEALERKFVESRLNDELPRSYTQHKVVMDSDPDEVAWPLALYAAGAPFQ